jgi:hypothetical protein
VGRLVLLLTASCLTGCWNSKDGLRADWGKGGSGLFDRGNAQARSKDRASNDSLDPADDVFLKGGRSELASRGKRKTDPDRPRPAGLDDEDSPLIEASGKEAGRPRGKLGVDDDFDALPGKSKGSPIEQTEAYKKVRGRLEAIKATWSSERLSGGQGYSVRCEVPHPTDPELAQVFEAKSADEMNALQAAVVQAEKWRSNVRRRFDPDEAKLDPFSP